MSLVKRHPLITFFILMFVLSWWPWPLYAMGVPWAISPLLPGPLLAALIVIPLTQGWAGLRELGLRMIRWRVGWRWYAVALGIPLAAAAVAGALIVALGAPVPALATLPPLDQHRHGFRDKTDQPPEWADG
jgi:CAAX protease family protein